MQAWESFLSGDPDALLPSWAVPKTQLGPRLCLAPRCPPSLPFAHSRALADVREASEREAQQA